MSDFSALKRLINISLVAARPYFQTSREYFFAIMEEETYKGLILEVEQACDAASEELATHVRQFLGNEEKLIRYLHEAKALFNVSAEFTKLIQVESSRMLELLVESDEAEEYSIPDMAYMQMAMAIKLHSDNVVSKKINFLPIPLATKKHIALNHIVGTGTYDAWQSLNEEIDRQLRLVDSSEFNRFSSWGPDKPNSEKNKEQRLTPSAIKLAAGVFNIGLFLSKVSLDHYMLTVIDSVLMTMGAVKQVSDDTFESIEEEGIGIPFMAVYRKLVEMNKVQDPKTSAGHLKLWVRFFESRYGAYITTPCSKYGVSVNKFCDAFIDAETAIKAAIRIQNGTSNSKK